MNRRKFINWFGFGAISTCPIGAIASCSKNPTAKTSASTVSGSAVKLSPGQFIKVGKVSQLKQEKRLSIKDGDLAVLVTLNKDTPVALNRICPHKACAVDIKADSNLLFCPCHGSTFKPDGTLLRGPAAESLEKYEAKVEGDAVLVKV